MTTTRIIAVQRNEVYAEVVDLQVRQCPVCGVVYGVPLTFSNKRQSDGGNWYCPNGDSLIFTKSKADRERERADAAENRAKQAENAARYQRERAEAAQRSARSYKGQVTKIRNRIAQGICPVPGCRRSGFARVKAHIAAKHPTWVAEHVHEMES